MRVPFGFSFIAFALAASFSTPAQSALVISGRSTQNISCDGKGACRATARNAILNVQTVMAMLSEFHSVDIVAPSLTKDIVIDAAISWADSNELTFEAARSVIVQKPIAVEGGGELNFSTAQDDKGELSFAAKGSATFRNAQGALSIDGKPYTLIADLPTLAIAMDRSPSGNFALAGDYDASADGTYDQSVVYRDFDGILEGLGHTISNLTVSDSNGQAIGFFEYMRGTTADLKFLNFSLQDYLGCRMVCGPLAAHNLGVIKRLSVKGSIDLQNPGQPVVGGIVGSNDGGVISNSSADIALTSRACCIFGFVGGISGANYGTIDRSYAEGKVTAYAGNYGPGGIAGYNYGTITNSYSLAKVAQTGHRAGGSSPGFYGGLVGYEDKTGKVVTSYAAGSMGIRHTAAGVGGYAVAPSGGFSKVYWDLDDGVGDPSKAVTNIPNYPGATGLTTAQLQSGLPQGFDPKIWAQNAAINNGLPYLISNPPVK